jgi:hypothetical protein
MFFFGELSSCSVKCLGNGLKLESHAVSSRGVELRCLAEIFFVGRLPSASVDKSPRGVAHVALAAVEPTKQLSSKATIEPPCGVATGALDVVKPKKHQTRTGLLSLNAVLQLVFFML